ncbi:MAG: NUDIX hydrolase [Paraclostridium sp.]
MSIKRSDIERSDEFLDCKLKIDECTPLFDKKITFDAYSLYPDMFDDVVKSIIEHNNSENKRKFRFIIFNGRVYDLKKFTGDSKYDIRNGVIETCNYNIVDTFKSPSIKNPVWDMYKGIWVEGNINTGRGQTDPYVIYDIGDLVIHGMKKSIMVIFRDSDNSVLCVEHMKCKNKFSLPAGTIEQNEVSVEAGIREMKEELDLNISKYDLDFVTSRISKYDRVDGIHHYFETILNHNKTINKDDITNMEPDKHPKLIWVNTKEFAEINKDLFTESTYEILTGGLVKWDI